MRSLIPALLAIVLAPSSSFAQAQDEPAGPANDPKFAASVTRMERALRALPSYAVAVKLDWKGDDGDVGATFFTFRFERPNRFRVEVRQAEGKEPSLIAVADGKDLTTYLPDRKLYARAPLPTPAHLAEADPFLLANLKGSLIDSLLRTDLKSYILARSQEVKHLGEDRLDGLAVDHFQLVWGLDDEEFWLGPADQTLPRKMVRVAKYTDDGNNGAVLKLTMTTALTWAIGKPLDPKSFTLDLPGDAKLVEDLESALANASPARLLGQPAPGIGLAKLGGGSIKLDDFKGKQSVVLAFWSTSNDESARLLLDLAKLRAEHKETAFLAVNAGETAQAVSAHLAKQPADLKILIDPDGKAADAIGIGHLPTLIVIDRDGLVRSVHESAGDDLLKKLRAELEAFAKPK